MGIIATTLIPTGLLSPVEITRINTYNDKLDINGAVVSFVNPYALNGVPWGSEGIESTGGSLSAVITLVGNLKKTQITLHWPSAHILDTNQSVKIAFNLAGEAKIGEFTELHTDLVEDPTALLSFFLQAPQAPEAIEQQTEIVVTSPSGITKNVFVSFGEKKELMHAFEGSYLIEPQPIKIGNATYYPEQDAIPFELTTSGQTITWDYKKPEYSVPVDLIIPSIGQSITTVMHVNAKKILVKLGSTHTIHLIVDKTYEIQFDTIVLNNEEYTIEPLIYIPQMDQNIVQMKVHALGIDTSTFIHTSLQTTGVPKDDLETPQVTLRRNDHDHFLYIFSVQIEKNMPIGLIKPGAYTIVVQNFTFDGIRYKCIEQDVVISSSSNQINVAFAEGFALTVPGWPAHLAHGGITFNSEAELLQYEKIAVECIFKYAGINGRGDRGVILDLNIIPTHKTIQHARRIEASQNHIRSVMPAMVFYTAELSSGVNDDDLRNDENLQIHYINLITELQVSQNYKDNQHLVPCTYIMNPDFLGMIQQNRNISSVIKGLFEPNSIHVNKQLDSAIAHLKLNDTPPVFENDIYGYIQSINWVMRHFGPDVVFGWQFNVWQDGNAYWAYQNPDQTTTIANSVADFIDEMQVYKGDYAPDFIVFDKYERDDFGPDAIGAYAWGARSWKRYVKFVDIISKRIRSPAMLWQIPGSHMPNTQEGSNLVHNGHAGSGGSFFMGDAKIGSNISTIDQSLLLMQVSNPYYYANTIEEILAQDNFYDWGQQELENAIDSNVFSILWGGGRTTGLVVGFELGTDPVWLANRVNAYYQAPITFV